MLGWKVYISNLPDFSLKKKALFLSDYPSDQGDTLFPLWAVAQNYQTFGPFFSMAEIGRYFGFEPQQT